MLKIAICEDEMEICFNLEDSIGKACGQLQEAAKIDTFANVSEMEKELKQKAGYHLLFLDIELQDGTGIDIGHFLRDNMGDDMTQIVFVSGKNGYDRQLFDLCPLGFLEKPVEYGHLIKILQRYLRIYGKKEDRFHYKFGRDVFCVNLNEVLYFKSEGKKIIIKKMESAEEFIGALKDVELQLSKRNFFMPNRSYLVNYQYVRVFRPSELLMGNGEVISVSRRQKEKVGEMILRMENGKVI